MLHSILGAYTCYRPDVGYVSEVSQYFIILLSKRKVRYCPAHVSCKCQPSAFVFAEEYEKSRGK